MEAPPVQTASEGQLRDRRFVTRAAVVFFLLWIVGAACVYPRHFGLVQALVLAAPLFFVLFIIVAPIVLSRVRAIRNQRRGSSGAREV